MTETDRNLKSVLVPVKIFTYFHIQSCEIFLLLEAQQYGIYGIPEVFSLDAISNYH